MASSSTLVLPAAAPKTKTNASYLFQLPVFGSPVCLGKVKSGRTERLNQMRAGVEGDIAPFSNKDFIIHPSFCDNPRWNIASRLLALATRVYVNEDGANTCSVNSGTIITNAYQRVGGCPHLFGHVLVIVTENALKKAGINHFSFVLVEEFEPEDDEANEAKKKECAEKGYDYYEAAGQVYLRPV